MDGADQNRWKQASAEAAARLVEDGMAVGLGTGSTASLFVVALAQRIEREKLRVTGIPTSQRTAELAGSLKIPLTSFGERSQLDLTVDGADEVERQTLFLIKGHGGALLREKIVAAASERMIVIADESKLVARLGSRLSVPVEVVTFGWQVTMARLAELGGHPSLRIGADQKPFVTDSGNHIIDCGFGEMEKPKEVAHHLDHVVGVIEHGLFLGFASEVLVGGPNGVKVVKK
jgi:ribose 5-phosphate isomerase A